MISGFYPMISHQSLGDPFVGTVSICPTPWAVTYLGKFHPKIWMVTVDVDFKLGGGNSSAPHCTSASVLIPALEVVRRHSTARPDTSVGLLWNRKEYFVAPAPAL